jgi:CRP-like cAMP-binding protein
MPRDTKKGSRKRQVSSRVSVGPDNGDDVFDCLTGAECKLIRMHSDVREVRKEETIYAQGDVENNIYMLYAGAVKLTKITPQGNELIADILGRRLIFGEIPYLDKQRRNESAVVLEDGLLCPVSRDDLFRIEETAPKLAARMKGLMEDRRRRREDRLVDIIFHTVEQRFAEALLNLIHDFGSLYKGRYRLNISLTHQAYADLVASTRETLTAVLTRLRKSGIIDYEGKSIIIHSVDKLNEIARFTCGPGMEG